MLATMNMHQSEISQRGNPNKCTEHNTPPGKNNSQEEDAKIQQTCHSRPSVKKKTPMSPQKLELDAKAEGRGVHRTSNFATLSFRPQTSDSVKF